MIRRRTVTLLASLALAVGLFGSGYAVAAEYFGSAVLYGPVEVYPNDFRCWFGQTWTRVPSINSSFDLDFNVRNWAKRGNSSCPTEYPRPAGLLSNSADLMWRPIGGSEQFCNTFGFNANNYTTYMWAIGAPSQTCGAGEYWVNGYVHRFYNGAREEGYPTSYANRVYMP